MTKQNPRPRKYASEAEKQAAYRARAAEVCVRVEPKTMATLDSIAQELGYTRNELMQSMVKFALTNRDWREEGLTAHKRLPRYQENPGMIPKLKRHVGSYAVVEIKTGQVVGELFKDSKLLDKVNFDKYKLVPIDEWLASLSRKENPIMATRTPTPAQLAARARFAEMARSGALNRKRKTAAKKKAAAMPLAANPRKKTVSQKISQLVHEGYPQKQAVAVALTEQRAGKVKRNPQAKSVASAYSANFKYCVEAKRLLGSAGSVFEMVAGFNTKTQAQNYIDAILASHPGVTLRIKTHK